MIKISDINVGDIIYYSDNIKTYWVGYCLKITKGKARFIKFNDNQSQEYGIYDSLSPQVKLIKIKNDYI